MAPEMIKTEPYDDKLDIWCLGILLYEMLHGYAPYGGRNDKEKCLNIVRNMPIRFGEHISKDAEDLIRRILRPNPSERFSIQQILSHKWMKGFEGVLKIKINDYIKQQDDLIRGAKDPRTQEPTTGKESFYGDSQNDQYGDITGVYVGHLVASELHPNKYGFILFF